MKMLLDRPNPLYGRDYKFKEVYVLTSAAENEPEVPKRAITGIEGWIECFDRARLGGSVLAGGVTTPGEIKDHPALKTAYDLGKNI